MCSRFRRCQTESTAQAALRQVSIASGPSPRGTTLAPAMNRALGTPPFFPCRGRRTAATGTNAVLGRAAARRVHHRGGRGGGTHRKKGTRWVAAECGVRPLLRHGAEGIIVELAEHPAEGSARPPTASCACGRPRGGSDARSARGRRPPDGAFGGIDRAAAVGDFTEDYRRRHVRRASASRAGAVRA